MVADKQDHFIHQMAETPDGSSCAIAPERLSELIGTIYDCVLEPGNWQLALGEICQEIGVRHAVLGYYETPSGNPLLRVQHGMAREWFDRMPDYGPDMAEFWGGVEKILSYPLGEVVAHSIAHPGVDFSQNRFASEWCKPQGIVDLYAISLTCDKAGLSSLVFTSDQKKSGPAFDHELDVLRLLAPHVRRVVTISKLLDLKSIEAASFRAALQALPIGLLLLDENMRVVHANAAADTAMARRDAIRLVNGRLTLRDAAAAAALASAVTASARSVTLGQRGIGIPARSRSGGGAILHVLPLDHRALRRSVPSQAVAALFISNAETSAKLPADALSVLYDLTPAEARICELIAEGLPLAAIALRIGVATSTAKTHLHKVFAKTGTNRQVDLVRLFASLSIAVDRD